LQYIFHLNKIRNKVWLRFLPKQMTGYENSSRMGTILYLLSPAVAKMAAPIITLLLVLLIADGNARAAANTVIVDVNATVNSSVQLTISPLTINFPDANPDITPSISAMENPLMVTALAQTGNKKTVLLTVQAQGGLISGSDSIPITNLRWTATGQGFVPGTMSRTNAVTAGTWVGPGEHTGTFSFFLANSWQYAQGNYHSSVIYTLTIP
jgi:hypothetical protein